MVMARSYTPYHPGLLTDLYHPDSCYVAWRAGQNGQATFDLYVRRAQEPYVATRSSRIGGAFSTSFLGAAFRFRLPSTGTVPHALIQLFDSER